MRGTADVLGAIKNGVSPAYNAKIAKTVATRVAARKDAEGEAEGEVAKELSEEAQAALTAAMRILAPFEGELTAEDMAAMAEALNLAAASAEDMEAEVAQSDDKADDSESEKEASADGDAEDEDEEDAAKSAEAPAGLAPTHKSHAGKGAPMPKDMAEIAKSVPESIRKNLAPIFKAHAELQAKHEKVAKALQVETDHRLTREFEAKAEAYTHLGISPQKLGGILKSLHATDGKLAGEVEGVFKQLNGQAKAGGIFDEVGSRMGSNPTSDAKARADARISEIKKSVGAAKTAEQIAAEFYLTDEGRALYREQQLEKARA